LKQDGTPDQRVSQSADSTTEEPDSSPVSDSTGNSGNQPEEIYKYALSLRELTRIDADDDAAGLASTTA